MYTWISDVEDDKSRAWRDRPDLSTTRNDNRSCYEKCLPIDIDVIELRHSVHANRFGSSQKLGRRNFDSVASANCRCHPISCEQVRCTRGGVHGTAHRNCCQHNAGRFVNSVITSLALRAPYSDSPHREVYVRAMPVEVEVPGDVHHLESLARSRFPSVSRSVSLSGSIGVLKPPVSPTTVSTTVGSSSLVSLEKPCTSAPRFLGGASPERSRSQPSVDCGTSVPTQFFPASNIYITIYNGGVKGDATKISSRQTGRSRSHSISPRATPRKSVSRDSRSSASNHNACHISSWSSGSHESSHGDPADPPVSQSSAVSVTPYVEVQDYEQTEITEYIEQPDGVWKATDTTILPRADATTSAVSTNKGIPATPLGPSPAVSQTESSPFSSVPDRPGDVRSAPPLKASSSGLISAPLTTSRRDFVSQPFQPATLPPAQPMAPHSTAFPFVTPFSPSCGSAPYTLSPVRVGPTILAQSPLPQPALVSANPTTCSYLSPRLLHLSPTIRSRVRDSRSAVANVSSTPSSLPARSCTIRPSSNAFGNDSCRLSDATPFRFTTANSFPPPLPTIASTRYSPTSFQRIHCLSGGTTGSTPAHNPFISHNPIQRDISCPYSTQFARTVVIPSSYPSTYASSTYCSQPSYPWSLPFSRRLPAAGPSVAYPSCPATGLIADTTTSPPVIRTHFPGFSSKPVLGTQAASPSLSHPPSHGPRITPTIPSPSTTDPTASMFPSSCHFKSPRRRVEKKTIKIRSQRTIAPAKQLVSNQLLS